MTTIDLKASDGVWTPGSLETISWKAACQILEIGSPQTCNLYRQWMGLQIGEPLTPDKWTRLSCMAQFCRAGRGRYYSRRNYLVLEQNGELASVLSRLRISPEPWPGNE